MTTGQDVSRLDGGSSLHAYSKFICHIDPFIIVAINTKMTNKGKIANSTP